jgi:phenylpropionate dioxygenase-like ring-hydroxylating dioxygenase large terminal subunit
MLPRRAYYSAAWLEEERERIFSLGWQLAAFAEDLPGGAALGCDIGFEPIFLVRSSSGVRAFSNVCRHRGLPLVDGRRRLVENRVRCTYHHWQYDLTDGALISVPSREKEFAELDIESCGLRQLSTAIWRGLIFVKLGQDATTHADFISGLEEHCAPIDLDNLATVYQRKVVVRCNWKLLVENHIDLLHLSHLHGDSLAMYDHSSCRSQWVGRHWVSVEELIVDRRHLLNNDERGLPNLPGMHEAELARQRANFIWPSILEVSSATRVGIYQLRPLSPEHTELAIRIFGSRDGRMTPYGEQRLLKVLIGEDATTLEALQRSVRSHHFAPQYGSGADQAISKFHESVLAALNPTSSQSD